MTRDSAIALRKKLFDDYNIQMVGVAETTNTIVVYTHRKPTKKELAITEFEGCKVLWHKCGPLRLLKG